MSIWIRILRNEICATERILTSVQWLLIKQIMGNCSRLNSWKRLRVTCGHCYRIRVYFFRNINLTHTNAFTSLIVSAGTQKWHIWMVWRSCFGAIMQRIERRSLFIWLEVIDVGGIESWFDAERSHGLWARRLLRSRRSCHF